MNAFVEYLVAVSPGLTLFVVAIVLVPARMIGVRTVVAILAFLFARDAMTPAGLWIFDVSPSGIPWLRFPADPAAYWFMAATSAVLIAAVLVGFGREARLRLRWLGTRWWETPAWGLAGAAVVIAPFAVMYADVPIAERGGPVAAGAIPALLAMAFAGNTLEEVLFRGYLQGTLVEGSSARSVSSTDSRPAPRSGSRSGSVRAPIGAEVRAGLASGVLFAAGHLHLAMLVTDVGWPLIGFVLLEGFVCGLVRIRGGMVGSTITHGGAIFVLAAGVL